MLHKLPLPTDCAGQYLIDEERAKVHDTCYMVTVEPALPTSSPTSSSTLLADTA